MQKIRTSGIDVHRKKSVAKKKYRTLPQRECRQNGRSPRTLLVGYGNTCSSCKTAFVISIRACAKRLLPSAHSIVVA